MTPEAASMPFTISRHIPLLVLAAAAGIAVGTLPCAQSADATHGFGQPLRRDKDKTCTERAHERVEALMAGVPWVRSDHHPAAKNRPCK
jgi:hypothetical protein